MIPIERPIKRILLALEIYLIILLYLSIYIYIIEKIREKFSIAIERRIRFRYTFDRSIIKLQKLGARWFLEMIWNNEK